MTWIYYTSRNVLWCRVAHPMKEIHETKFSLFQLQSSLFVFLLTSDAKYYITYIFIYFPPLQAHTNMCIIHERRGTSIKRLRLFDALRTLPSNVLHFTIYLKSLWKYFMAPGQNCAMKDEGHHREVWQFIHFLCVWKIRSSKLGTDTSCFLHCLHENQTTGHISYLYYFHSVYHVRTLIQGRSSLQDLSLSTVQLGQYSYAPLPGTHSQIYSYHSPSSYNIWFNSTFSLPPFLSLASSTHSLQV
jgi:hypothetical protein